MKRPPERCSPSSRLRLPLWARSIFALLLGRDDRRSVTNDLAELFELRRGRDGERAARAWLRRQLVRYPHRLLAERLSLAAVPRAEPPKRHDTPRHGGRFGRSGEPMQNLLRDLKHSLRGLGRAPVLAATIVLTVGLGIGSTTLLWSVIHGVLIAPLPYEDSRKLVRMYLESPRQAPLSVADYLALKEQQTSFDQVAGFTLTTMTYQGGEVVERLRGKWVTWNYFSLLGVSPFLGRSFHESDGKPGNAPTIIVSHGFWNRYLGADENAVGRTLRLDGADYRLVGVLPRDVGPLDAQQELFAAVEWQPPPRRGPFFIFALGRLREGIEPAVAAEELRAINRRIFPIWESTYQDKETSWGMMSLKDVVLGDVAGRLGMAFAAVAFVLLIACANAANLLVARVVRRRRELAVRNVLGASRGRLLQHLLAESGVLALLAALVGFGLSVAGVRLLVTVGAGYIPRAREIALDGPVFSFLAILTLGSALLFGLIPSLLGARLRADRGLRSVGRRASDGVGARRLRHALVVAQFAVATPLLVAAGLLLVSLLKLERLDLGFDRHNLLSAAVLLPETRYPHAGGILRFWDEAKAAVEALPGVEAAAYADARPPYDTGMSNNFFVEERPTPPGHPDPVVPWVAASPDYFELMGIPLLKGRLLDDRDGADGMNAVVVDQAWARRFFPGEDAVGRRIRQGGCPECPWATVVGLVGDVEYNGLANPDRGVVYWPMADRPVHHALDQITQRFRYFILRTSIDPRAVVPSLRQTLHELDPELPLWRISTMEELLASSLETPRYLSRLVGALAFVALLLSVIGIYGVMSYFVEQRSREIGIRIALGGRPESVLRRMVGLGMRVVALGVVLGLAGALGLTRLMSSLLFEVEARDATTFLTVSAVLLGAALVACLPPARRAAAVDPATTLREE